MVQLKRMPYAELKSDRQKENYNYAKLAAALADYGFACIRLSDDWNSADLIAIHADGQLDLKIQLKGRFTACRKYIGKGLFVAFRQEESWFLYDHDKTLDQVLPRIEDTDSWQNKGEYSWPSLPEWAATLLEGSRLK